MRHTALIPAVKPSNPSSPPRSAGRAVGGIWGFGARILAAGPALSPTLLRSRTFVCADPKYFAPPASQPRTQAFGSAATGCPDLALRLLAKPTSRPPRRFEPAPKPDAIDEAIARFRTPRTLDELMEGAPVLEPWTRGRRARAARRVVWAGCVVYRLGNGWSRVWLGLWCSPVSSSWAPLSVGWIR